MRVLYFHQHFTTPDGSGGTRSYEFARALVARGHHVTMVCGQFKNGGLNLPWDEEHGWNAGKVAGIDVIALPLAYSNRDSIARRVWVFLKFAWRSILIALHAEYDVLFATSTPLTAAIPGIAMKLLRRGRPFVFEVRDLWPELPRALGMRNPVLLGGMSVLEWMAYRCADACVGLSPGIVEGIKRRAPAGQEITMIPNGCDLELFRPDLRAPLQLAGVQPADFVAGFTGTHGVANGLDAVIDAASELKRCNRKDIKLVLIGDGNQRERLIERAKDLDNCLFFPPVRKNELSKIVASFGCGLQILADVPAFYYGTSPNKFFDYISAGIPVITNYPGWVADLIRRHDCGIAVPPGRPDSLAAALIRLADDSNAVKRHRTASRRLAEESFSRPMLADRFAAVLEEVVASANKS